MRAFPTPALFPFVLAASCFVPISSIRHASETGKSEDEKASLRRCDDDSLTEADVKKIAGEKLDRLSFEESNLTTPLTADEIRIKKVYETIPKKAPSFFFAVHIPEEAQIKIFSKLHMLEERKQGVEGMSLTGSDKMHATLVYVGNNNGESLVKLVEKRNSIANPKLRVKAVAISGLSDEKRELFKTKGATIRIILHSPELDDVCNNIIDLLNEDEQMRDYKYIANAKSIQRSGWLGANKYMEKPVCEGRIKDTYSPAGFKAHITIARTVAKKANPRMQGGPKKANPFLHYVRKAGQAAQTLAAQTWAQAAQAAQAFMGKKVSDGKKSAKSVLKEPEHGEEQRNAIEALWSKLKKTLKESGAMDGEEVETKKGDREIQLKEMPKPIEFLMKEFVLFSSKGGKYETRGKFPFEKK